MLCLSSFLFFFLKNKKSECGKREIAAEYSYFKCIKNGFEVTAGAMNLIAKKRELKKVRHKKNLNL